MWKKRISVVSGLLICSSRRDLIGFSHSIICFILFSFLISSTFIICADSALSTFYSFNFQVLLIIWSHEMNVHFLIFY